MKIAIDIPDYVKGEGIDVIWNEKCFLKVNKGCCESVIISGNESALRALGEQLIYLSQSQVETGSHIHYDDFFCKDSDIEFIVEKIDKKDFI